MKIDVTGSIKNFAATEKGNIHQGDITHHQELTINDVESVITELHTLLGKSGESDNKSLIAPIKEALEAEENQSSLTKEIISAVWQGINGLTDFTKDKLLPIGDFVIKHKAELIAVVAVAKNLLK